MTRKKIAQMGGNAVAAKYGRDHFVEIGREGGYATLEKYGVGFLANIGSKGGMISASRRKVNSVFDGRPL